MLVCRSVGNNSVQQLAPSYQTRKLVRHAAVRQYEIKWMNFVWYPLKLG